MAYGFNNDKSKVDVVPLSGSGAMSIGNTDAYFLFKTNSIGSFTLPSGVTYAFVLDTSTGLLYSVNGTVKARVKTDLVTSNPGWTVIEHANGIVELEYQTTDTISQSEWNAWGGTSGLYWATFDSNIKSMSYPVTFTEKPSIRCEIIDQSPHEILMFSIGLNQTPYTTPPWIYAVSPLLHTDDVTVTAKIIVTGRVQ